MKNNLLAVPLIVLSVSCLNGAVIINEIANGNGGAANSMDQDEAIEILLTTDYTATALNGLAFGDSTASTADKFSQLEIGDLSSIATVFKAGTLIVLAGDNFTANTSYSPSSGGSDDDWSITLLAGSSYFSENATLSDGDILIVGTGDIVWVDFNNTGDTDFDVDHAVGWDTGTEGAFLTSGGNVVNTGFSSGLDTGDFVTFTGGAADILDSTKFVDNGPTGSLGAPNGGDNSTFINGLRAIPEPSSIAFLSIGMIALLRRRR